MAFPRCNARIKCLKDTALRTCREVEGCDTVNTSSVMTHRYEDAEATHLLPGAVEGDGVKLQFSGSEKLMWFNHQTREGSYGRHCLTTFIRTNDKNMLKLKQLCLHCNTDMYYNVTDYENIW